MTLAMIAVSILISLAANEIFALSPWIADKLVRWSAYRHYEDLGRAEYRAEELARLIKDCPSNLFKVLISLGFAAESLVVLVCRVQRTSVAGHRLQVTAKIAWHRMNAAVAPLLTELALFFVGRKRRQLRDEWRGHLAGIDGSKISSVHQVRAACGFVRAAVIMRSHDATDLAWRPADAVLRSRILSRLFVWIPLLATALTVVCEFGLHGLLTKSQNIVALWISSYAAIRIGRWWRGL